VIQAVRSFGPEAAGDIPVESLSKKLPTAVKSDLKRFASAAPVWSQSVLRSIAL
jgi:hypothetical protein